MVGLSEFDKKVEMNQFSKLLWVFCVCVCAFALTGQAALADSYADAKRAEATGDYAIAAKRYRALAEQGDSRAQNYLLLAAEKGEVFSQEELGAMYASGIGFPQDYNKAAKWYQLAAGNGVALSQGKLGAMYASGQGVPQNFVLSHMWLNIASTNAGSQEQLAFIKSRDSVARKMTARQIAKSNQLARKCTINKFRGCSNLAELTKTGETAQKAKATVMDDSKRHDPEVTTATTPQQRRKYSDLTDCLNLQSYEAIAQCAGESKSRKEAGTGRL